MKTISRIVTVIALSTVLLSLAPALQVQAQAGDLCFEVTFGGALVDEDCLQWTRYSHTIPTYVQSEVMGGCPQTAGTVYQNNVIGTNFQCGGEDLYQNIAYVNITLPAGCDVNTWNAPYSLENVVLSGRTSVANWSSESDVGVSHNTPLSTTSGFVNWSPPSWNEGASPSHYAFAITQAKYGSPPDQASFDYISFTCEDYTYNPGSGIGDSLFQPITESAQVDVYTAISPSGVYLSTSEILATGRAFAKKPGTVHPPYVYAAISGTVTQILPEFHGQFVVKIEGEVDGAEFTAHYANLEDVFVTVGDEVLAGCVIGVAGPQIRYYEYDEPLFELRDFYVRNDDTNQLQNWTLYDDPSGSEACSQDSFTSGCVNSNPNFGRQGADWYGIPNIVFSRPFFEDGLAHVPKDSKLAQDIVIPEAELTSYIVTIKIAVNHQQPGFSRLNVSLGNDEDSVLWNGSGDTNLKVVQTAAITPTEPDIGPDIYTLEISANTNVKITSVCMQPEETAMTPVASACYFADPGFDTGDNWTFMGGAVIAERTFSPVPLIQVTDTDTVLKFSAENAKVTTPISLSGYEDRDATYKITLSGMHTAPISINPVADYAHIYVDIDMTDDDYDHSETLCCRATFIPKNASFEYTVPAGVTASGTFEMEVPFFNGNVTDVYLEKVCITPLEGYWPGESSVPPPESMEICARTVAAPSGVPTDIVSVGAMLVGWLAWVGQYVGITIECQIAKLIEALLAPIGIISWWLGMIGRWFSVVMSRLYKLLMYLRNTSLGIIADFIEALWEAFIALPLFAWLFDFTGLAALVVSLASALISAIMTLVVTAVKLLGTLGQMVYIIWTYILAGINGSDTADVDIPSCVGIATDNFFYPMCRLISLIDYMFVLYPVGWAIVAALIVMMAYGTFDNIRGLLRRTFSEAG